ncbi:MAG: cytochrome c biogenesis protein CcsA [Rikenellaceae bacterium]
MIKKIAFTLYVIITVVLISATVFEKFEGTTAVHDSIYSAWWFYSLWGAMTLFALWHIVRGRLFRVKSVFMVHISFVVILLGALASALTAQRGMIYLNFDEPQSSFTSDSGDEVSMPFSVTLVNFEIEYYSGTKAVANYISDVEFSEREGVMQKANISMNNIARYRGYRFYQSEYDKWGSILSVNYDPYGIPLTYGGYFLLALSLVWMFVDRRGAFRRLLRGAMTSLVVVIATGCGAASSDGDKIPQTLSESQIESLSKLQVVYNDRVMPLSTLAHDFTLKLVGSTKYKSGSSEQFFWGWLLFPTEWENEAIFEVPLSEKQEFLQLREYSSYADFFTDKKVYKLNHYIRNTEQKTQPALYKELNKLNEKVQLVAMLRSGAMAKLFPYRDTTGHITWYSPVDELPSEMDRGQALFIEKSFDLLLSAYGSGNLAEFEEIASKIYNYQRKYGEESLLSDEKFVAEEYYYWLPVTKIIYRWSLLLGIVGVIVLVIFGSRVKVERWALRMMRIWMIHCICFLTLYVGLKWYITGRMPLVNGYDTMVFLGWAIAVLNYTMRRVSALLMAMGTTLVGFTMLVASIGGMNPQITPLMPVLNSPLLSSHVCTIMLGYALFAFTFTNAILALTLGRKDKELLRRFTSYSRLFLVIAVAFLAVGIFIGAMWANVSWGRYWAWDPKEVWALITMLVYALPLHTNSLKIFRSPRFFHIYLLIAFLSVIMTYFGVNYILGGMHSYVN